MNHTTDPTAATNAAMAALAGSGLIISLVFLAIFIFSIVIYWRIASKAGYPGVASLLLLIPLVNIIMIIIFAFSEWPIEKRAKGMMGAGPGTPGTPWQHGMMNPPATS